MVAEAVAIEPEDAVATAAPQPMRWTKEQYYRMGEAGLFDGQHVELIDGEIIKMSPISRSHVVGVVVSRKAAEHAFGEGFYVADQSPINAGEHDEPQPDVAVYPGDVRDELEHHPSNAVLIIEVSDTTLRYDRTTKASLYARAGLPDYWVVNLKGRRLEVRRDPVPMPDQPLGYGYAQTLILQPGDKIAPLAKPDVEIAVDDLLP